MANRDQIKTLKLGSDHWNTWRISHPESTIDLVSANLWTTELPQVNLAKANLSKAVMTNANLQSAKLVMADLDNAIIRGANLDGADLRGANLSNADLSGASLRRVVLRGANLAAANMYRADLSDSDLTDVVMCETYLLGVNLTSTWLHGADLDKATCGQTNFANVDLSTTRGLTTIKHDFPSTLGVDTLFLSKGKIPNIFLQGCGVPENLITFLPSFMNDAIQFYSCFISYSHVDKDFARRLHDRLQAQGIRCWLDEHQLKPGDKLYATIDGAIRQYDKVVLCCSKSSLDSWWVEKEFENTLNKERHFQTEILIPIDIDEYLFRRSKSTWVKDEIKKRYVQSFQGWKDPVVFEAAFAKVVKALRTDGGVPPPPEPKLKRR